jgi:spore coat polysaccharide biosynthesis predicted glycosyltransferase SpsG
VNVKPSRLLITFGGTDPAHLTERVEELIKGMAYPNLDLYAIAPPGRVSNPAPVSMAHELLAADLVITSGGRTVYEAAACGTPTLVITQNTREATHVHLGWGGNINLGLGGLVSDHKIQRMVRHVLDHVDLRLEMAKAGQLSVDGRGARRIARRIEDLLEGL